MPTEHLYDDDLRCKIKYPNGVEPCSATNVVGKYRPDWCAKVNNEVRCVEYENSSRGMLIHVAKYCKLAREFPNVCYSVLIVESRHHQKEHVQDRELACFVWQELHKTLTNLTIKFENCDNNIDTFQDKVNTFFKA
jgi:hypothetical protein